MSLLYTGSIGFITLNSEEDTVMFFGPTKCYVVLERHRVLSDHANNSRGKLGVKASSKASFLPKTS